MFPENHYFSLGSDESGTLFVCCGDEVLIVPLTSDNQVIFITEPSAAFGENMVLLPCGSININEEHHDTANRELQEEIGMRAKKLIFLGQIAPWSKYLSVRSFVFLAQDFTESKLEGDEDYEIGQLIIPLSQTSALVASGQLMDARVIAAMSMVNHYLNQKEV